MRLRLSDEVAVRLHVVDGERRYVLHDPRTGSVGLLGVREWRILSAADGTRDAEGVAAAARLRGARVTAEEVVAWFDELRAAGVLVEAPATGAPGGADPRRVPSSVDVRTEGQEAEGPRSLDDRMNKALVPLPGYRFSCDGRGSCCRFYPTTLFTGPEVARARAFAPHALGCGEDASRAFTPSRGGGTLSPDDDRRSWGGAAVAMVDGSCAFLDECGCQVHRHGGSAAKPTGCRLYPASFCDVGETVRVTPVPECACVFRSTALVDSSQGEPLVDARGTADLDPLVFVRRLPERLPVSAERTWSRTEYLAWHRRTEAAWAPTPPPDAVLALLTLAAEFDGSPVPRATDIASALGESFDELRARARRRRGLGSTWRSAVDLARLVPEWIATALDAGGDLAALSPRHGDEAFYLTALAHGHLWLDEDRSLAAALRARAARIVVARALPSVVPTTRFDPALEHPLALVEAACRWL